jgi:hypothetical protein
MADAGGACKLTRHSWTRFILEALVQVRHYADDLHWLRTGADEDALGSGFAPSEKRPEAARQTFIDDRDRRDARDILGCELTAQPQWNLECAEMSWTDLLYNPERPFVQLQRRLIRPLQRSSSKACQGKSQCYVMAAPRTPVSDSTRRISSSKNAAFFWSAS